MTTADQLRPAEPGRLMKAYERDPRWQQARSNYLERNDRDRLGPSELFQVRQAAIAEMYRIELAYEADPGLTPPVSFELTPVHDPARCRHRSRVRQGARQ
jgi:hypothetical protein